MAELKTQANDGDVDAFLAGVEDPARRADALAVCTLLADVTGEPAVMWGSAIVGFGHRTMHYADGRELDWLVIGFSPRKANTTIYLSGGIESYGDLLARLGKHSRGKGCLSLKRLRDVDLDVLRAVLERSVKSAGGPAT